MLPRVRRRFFCYNSTNARVNLFADRNSKNLFDSIQKCEVFFFLVSLVKLPLRVIWFPINSFAAQIIQIWLCFACNKPNQFYITEYCNQTEITQYRKCNKRKIYRQQVGVQNLTLSSCQHGRKKKNNSEIKSKYFSISICVCTTLFCFSFVLLLEKGVIMNKR